MKLRTKHREGRRVRRTYHDARTPLQRLVASAALPKDTQDRLVVLFQALDPVRLLQQLHALQEAFWQHAILPAGATDERMSPAPAPAPVTARRFDVQDCGLPVRASRDANDAEDAATSSRAELTALLAGRGLSTRKYRRSTTHTARTWRTPADPFTSLWGGARQRVACAPERTPQPICLMLQQ